MSGQHAHNAKDCSLTNKMIHEVQKHSNYAVANLLNSLLANHKLLRRVSAETQVFSLMHYQRFLFDISALSFTHRTVKQIIEYRLISTTTVFQSLIQCLTTRQIRSHQVVPGQRQQDVFCQGASLITL